MNTLIKTPEELCAQTKQTLVALKGKIETVLNVKARTGSAGGVSMIGGADVARSARNLQDIAKELQHTIAGLQNIIQSQPQQQQGFNLGPGNSSREPENSNESVKGR